MFLHTVYFVIEKMIFKLKRKCYQIVQRNFCETGSNDFFKNYYVTLICFKFEDWRLSIF